MLINGPHRSRLQLEVRHIRIVCLDVILGALPVIAPRSNYLGLGDADSRVVQHGGLGPMLLAGDLILHALLANLVGLN